MVSSKSNQRRQAYDARNAQLEREQLSQIITAKVLAQNEYQRLSYGIYIAALKYRPIKQY